MCRIFAAELSSLNTSSQDSSFEVSHLLTSFAKACESDAWNAPDGSKQEDGWGMYATLSDKLGTLRHLYHLAEELNSDQTESKFEFGFDGDAWRILYVSINAIWEETEAEVLASKLPRVKQVMVHARAALNGTSLSNNQPYLSDDTVFAANTSLTPKQRGAWSGIKDDYPEFRALSHQIGTMRLSNLLQLIRNRKNLKLHPLLELNNKISEKFNVSGMNVVTLTDTGISALCGTHVPFEQDLKTAGYYTLCQGRNVKIRDQRFNIIASAPFAGMSLKAMKPGEVVYF